MLTRPAVSRPRPKPRISRPRPETLKTSYFEARTLMPHNTKTSGENRKPTTKYNWNIFQKQTSAVVNSPSLWVVGLFTKNQRASTPDSLKPMQLRQNDSWFYERSYLLSMALVSRAKALFFKAKAFTAKAFKVGLIIRPRSRPNTTAVLYFHTCFRLTLGCIYHLYK